MLIAKSTVKPENGISVAEVPEVFIIEMLYFIFIYLTDIYFGRYIYRVQVLFQITLL